jgi:hypothetical protein
MPSVAGAAAKDEMSRIEPLAEWIFVLNGSGRLASEKSAVAFRISTHADFDGSVGALFVAGRTLRRSSRVDSEAGQVEIAVANRCGFARTFLKRDFTHAQSVWWLLERQTIDGHPPPRHHPLAAEIVQLERRPRFRLRRLALWADCPMPRSRPAEPRCRVDPSAWKGLDVRP